MGEQAELDEGARVEEQVDPLSRGQLVPDVLLGDALSPGVSRASVTRRPSRCSSQAEGQAATPMIRPSIQPVHPLEQITRAHAPRTSAT